MAYIEMYRDKLAKNYKYLDQLFKENNIEWAVVTKLLCGSELYLRELIKHNPIELCDSRVSNLKVIKSIDPSIQTVYIKPPAKGSIEDIIRYADVSFNTESETIRMLSEEAKRQGKTHKIIIMIELGDLREGVMGEHVTEFYGSVFEMDNIEVTGIGTNLTCLHGVLPSQDKLIQLVLYKQLIEATFNQKIPWVTGGTTVVIPLLLNKQIPLDVNHFRVGEALFFGTNMLTNAPMEHMEQDVFRLFAEIIEITEKPKVPIGYMAENPSGEMLEVDEEDYGKTSYRAILDIGLLDISTDFLIPEDPNISFVGASSDMVVIDLGKTSRHYKVGDTISFKLKYMGALSLLNSDYVEQRLI